MKERKKEIDKEMKSTLSSCEALFKMSAQINQSLVKILTLG